jgi:hypothetical protein
MLPMPIAGQYLSKKYRRALGRITLLQSTMSCQIRRR